MYEAYWGLKQASFQNVPDPAFFCPLPAHEDILAKLLYVVQHNKGGALLTGEVGCGKSTLSRVFLLQLDEEKFDVGLVINPSLPADELLSEIAVQLGLARANSPRVALFRSLNEHLLSNAQAGRDTVLILDEAHVIRDDAIFEDLRMLLNFQFNDRHLLTVILLGLPDLKRMVAQQRALDQRLAVRLNIDPLSESETAKYIDFRLKKAGGTKPIFTTEAIKAIHQEADGIPRKINNLCDLCLFEGWRRKAAEVDPSLVKVAVAFT